MIFILHIVFSILLILIKTTVENLITIGTKYEIPIGVNFIY